MMNFIIQTVLGELLAVVVGIIVTWLMHSTWVRWRYGGWVVHLLRDGKQILEEKIPASKAREILNDFISMRIYLKGLVSAYEWLRCDLIVEGQKNGLFTIDKVNRRFIINLDKNPSSSAPAEQTS